MLKHPAYCWWFVFVAWMVVGRCAALAATQSLDLQLLPADDTTNRLQVTVSASGLSDSDNTRLSGNVLATIDYDLIDDFPVVTGIEFTGGQFNLRGSTTDQVQLTLDGGFLGQVNVVGSGLGGTLDTPSPPGVVANGMFNAADHNVIVNRGTLDATGTGIFSGVNDTFDMQQDPLTFSEEGTATLDVVQTAAEGLMRTFEVTLSMPVAATETIDETLGVTLDVMGVVTARDQFTVTLPLAGDYNQDAVVDAADYVVWRDSLGASGSGLAADGNENNVVDAADHGIWSANYGQSAAAATHVVAVPEPAAVMLIAAAVLMGSAAQRRRRVG